MSERSYHGATSRSRKPKRRNSSITVELEREHVVVGLTFVLLEVAPPVGLVADRWVRDLQLVDLPRDQRVGGVLAADHFVATLDRFLDGAALVERLLHRHEGAGARLPVEADHVEEPAGNVLEVAGQVVLPPLLGILIRRVCS